MACAVRERPRSSWTMSWKSVLALMTFLHASSCQEVEMNSRWGIMVDAGSSGSRVRIFRWPRIDSTGTMIREISVENREAEDALEGLPAMSSYAGNSSGVIELGKRIVEQAELHVPQHLWPETPIYVFATAGMRLLEPAKRQSIVAALSEWMADPSNNPFKYEENSVRVIAGSEEAAFAFITVNSLLGTLGSPGERVGAMDLGGASTQYTLEPETQQVLANLLSIYLPGDEIRTNANSYLHFGQDQALMRAHTNLLNGTDPSQVAQPVPTPCLRIGDRRTLQIKGEAVDFTGYGNYAQCEALSRELLHLDYECLQFPCAIAGRYQASPEGKFVAVSAFFFTLNGLDPDKCRWNDQCRSSLDAFKTLGEAFCTRAASADDNPFDWTRCFTSGYVYNLLSAYGFAADGKDLPIIFTRNLNGTNAGWAMGALMFTQKVGRWLAVMSDDAVIQFPVAPLGECVPCSPAEACQAGDSISSAVTAACYVPNWQKVALLAMCSLLVTLSGG